MQRRPGRQLLLLLQPSEGPRGLPSRWTRSGACWSIWRPARDYLALADVRRADRGRLRGRQGQCAQEDSAAGDRLPARTEAGGPAGRGGSPAHVGEEVGAARAQEEEQRGAQTSSSGARTAGGAAD
ncbi:hypothetical protein ON010_g6272 [Phytophthora cinnamomi]|nr:hypothetical protein ON010_g6272 [Phytophthora cinnamomi]